MFGHKRKDTRHDPQTPRSETEKDAMNVFSLFRDMLDYNDDNIIDLKDLQDATQDLENTLSKQVDFLRDQVEEARNANKKG